MIITSLLMMPVLAKMTMKYLLLAIVMDYLFLTQKTKLGNNTVTEVICFPK
jgi:hypothetical protein